MAGERALIRERTVAGLVEARRKGKTGGRPRRVTEKDITAAKAILADGALTSKEVAARSAYRRPRVIPPF